MRLGIDLGGSHIGIGLVDPHDGKIIKKVEQDIQANKDMNSYILEYINSNIYHFTQNYNIDLIGIASPGNPNQEELTIYNLVNLGIEKLNLKEISKKYNIRMQIKNDGKAAGLAEFKYGSLKQYNDAVFLCLGTGIGSAVFLNEKLMQSNRHIGFEMGHMIIDRNGLECNCGKKGCFETYCSMKRFKDNVNKILNINEISAKELLEKVKENLNNSDIIKLIDEYINNLIIGLSNIIDIFEPEAIAIGGSFVFFKDIFYKKLVDEMNKRKYVFNKENLPHIVLADLKNDAGIIGAVID